MTKVSCPNCLKQTSNHLRNCTNCGFIFANNSDKTRIINETYELSTYLRKFLNKIRTRNLLRFIYVTVRTSILAIFFVAILSQFHMIFQSYFIVYLLISLFVALITFASIVEFNDYLFRVLFPIKSSIVRGVQKFGDINDVVREVYDNETNVLFENREIALCNKIIIFKSDYEIFPIDDIICLYKYVRRRDFAVEYEGLTIKDKYGRSKTINWHKYNRQEISKIIGFLLSVNRNIKTGYNSDKNMKFVDLPKSKF